MEIKSKELFTIFAWRKSDWLGEAGPPRRGGHLRAPAERAHLDPRSQPVFGAGYSTSSLLLLCSLELGG